MTPFRKKFKFCSDRIHDHTDLCFVIKFYWNHPLGSEWNDALFCWQRSLQNVFFWHHFASIWPRVSNVCRGACHTALCSLSNFVLVSSDLPGLFPKKWFRTITVPYMLLANNCYHAAFLSGSNNIFNSAMFGDISWTELHVCNSWYV